MDIELLRTFLEVKNTRHFGKAAENLYLTQAAVSARVKQLETIIGAPLFTRFRNNLQLTTTGERLVNHAETILIAWERAKQDVSLKKKQQQVIAIGGSSGLWDLVLQDTLHAIHSNYPELAVRAEAHGSETLIRNLMERTLDLALVYEPAKISDLTSIQISAAELILVSDKPTQTPEQAMSKNYVSVDWGLNFQMSIAQLFPDAALPVLHTTLSRIALDFILKFGGSAYLPYRLVEPHIEKELFQVEEAPVITRQIYACYHKDNIRYKEIDSILELVRSLEVPVEEIPEEIKI
ncbi:LysR family transcriptional regulator [Litoribrevibacter albus]|uniref:LysR family transcriptional regulator n=1 Tax=Litoribrevibacter albus TaxID=1473156 RepID=A0AA37SBY0_9GAMM|nr:LysR family transcriptional regulator [Litoribrevibacter albus]GLQ31742.1 LysR family transcriptional regulator [Litoribrevibacter albus]